MKVLVTGGAGYIGSVVCEQLVARGDTVSVVDNFYQGHREAVRGCGLVIHADIRSASYLKDIFADIVPDAVIHLAALVAVEDSVRLPGLYYAVNGMGTLNVLEAMAAAGTHRLVFASSAAVYGNLPPDPVDEGHPVAPLHSYGQTKSWGEQMAKAFAFAHDMSATCFRFFNVAGATAQHGEWHNPETHLVPAIVGAAMSGEPVTIYGSDYRTRDGTALRDFIDVRDIARAHIAALDAPRGCRVYNLGSGAGYTCLEVVKAVAKASRRKIETIMAPRRAGDIAGMVADASKAQRELGWIPQYTLMDIAQGAWDWAWAHPGGYHAG